MPLPHRRENRLLIHESVTKKKDTYVYYCMSPDRDPWFVEQISPNNHGWGSMTEEITLLDTAPVAWLRMALCELNRSNFSNAK
jgi:hypothetical protein